MFGKIFALLFFFVVFLLGLLNIYRGLIDTNNMTKLTGVVFNKENVHWRGSRSSHYSAVFQIANYPNDIAMNLGVSGKAETDSVLRLVNLGDTYTFYLDPSVPVVNGITHGLNRIDYNSKVVYVKSRLFEVSIGLLFALTGLVVTILVGLLLISERNGI